MSAKLILTKMQIEHEEASNSPFIISAKIEDKRMVDLKLSPCSKQSLVNNIYIGRVDSIAENIHAIFVKFTNDDICYIPYQESNFAIFTKKNGKKQINIGDELLIQIIRDPIKTKLAAATTAISISGQYLVVSANENQCGVSKKISKKKKQELSDLVKTISDKYPTCGIVARTNAKNTTNEEIYKEADSLCQEFISMINNAKYKTCYSLIYTAPSEFLSIIKNSYYNEYDEIITDDEEKYIEIKNYMNSLPDDRKIPLSLYKDEYPLNKLYSLQSQINQALNKKVWLKSGAYLVIEYTEAMTVIDVNSGKNTKKDNGDFFLQINLEAAIEIARQIKLRNISGICLVDFIDMKEEYQRDELMTTLRTLLAQDHITTTLVDITKLNLVEITRKKVNRPLFEQVKENA